MGADAAQKPEMMFINYNICFPDRRTCPPDGCPRWGEARPPSLMDVYVVASSPGPVGVGTLKQGCVALER